MDPTNGNDANDGSSFALRFKTFTSGATAARIAPGDVIRVMRSPNPTSAGINATFTNKSITVSLASALNVLITNCDSAWTASANVTCTADTAVFRTATGAAKQAIAAGFTTGKVAYFDLGSNQDYSAYQGITFWYLCSANTAANVFSIRLCSDATGDVTVDNLAITFSVIANQWVPVHIDKGSALGASIRSIALYADVDPGTVNVNLDNINTTKAVGADCLTHLTLIGKNSGVNENWFAVRSINGTTVLIDASPNNTSSLLTQSRGYSGTTETVPLYLRLCHTTAFSTAGQFASIVQDSGTAGNVITFSGGWDTTDMTTQDGETWFDGRTGVLVGLSLNARSYINFEKCHWTRYDQGISTSGSNNIRFLGTTYLSHNLTANLYMVNGFDNYFEKMVLDCSSIYGVYFGNNYRLEFGELLSRGTGAANLAENGISFNQPCTGIKINTLTIQNCDSHGVSYNVSTPNTDISIGTLVIKDCGGTGMFIGDLSQAKWRIGTVTITDNSLFALSLSGAADIVIGSLTTSGNTSGCISVPNEIQYMDIAILQSSIAEATKVAVTAPGTSIWGPAYLRFENYLGVANDHRIFVAGGDVGMIVSETTVRHTASGVAWKISPKNAFWVSSFPLEFPVGRVWVQAGVSKTISLWMRRTNTALTGRLVVRLPGGSHVTDVSSSITVGADTWEQVSVNFTPTLSGIAKIEAHAFGGTTHSLYVDDLSVS
jgi:hypothetical protein